MLGGAGSCLITVGGGCAVAAGSAVLVVHAAAAALSGLVLAVSKAYDGPPEPGVKYPGDDPTVSTGEGFEWRGKGTPAEGKGDWYNPKTGE